MNSMCGPRRKAGLYPFVLLLRPNALKRVQLLRAMRESMELLESLPLCAHGMALRRIDASRLIPCDTWLLHEHEHDALVRKLIDVRVERRVVCMRETT